jgi:hypothetical protein
MRLSTFPSCVVIEQAPLLTFDAEQHLYTLTGRPVRSVTQLLHKVGLVNFDQVPPTILSAASRRGTAVHKAVHYFNEHDLDVAAFDEAFPEYSGYLHSWIRLLDSGRLRTFRCEQRIASFSPRFAGTTDWIGWVDEQATLIDFATGSPEDACKHLQLAGYVLGLRAWAHVPGDDVLTEFVTTHPYVKRIAVRLDRTGKLPQLEPYDDPRDLTKFLLIAETVNIVDAERPRSIPWNWEQDGA